ncbi:MAG: hypothetical protein IJT30_11335 [Muribaculaceae bacterium]|nr:hypothetical protein [Muribaculaceae bacterium]
MVIDSHLGRRGTTKAAFSHGDVFASLFGSYLCGGDAIEDVIDIKPFRGFLSAGHFAFRCNSTLRFLPHSAAWSSQGVTA